MSDTPNAVEIYLAWLLPILEAVDPEAFEANPVQLGAQPMLPIKVRPYWRVQVPVVPEEPFSLSHRRHRMVTTITLMRLYTDTETPLLVLQSREAQKLKDALMENAPRPFAGALEPMVEQTVYDERDGGDDQAAMEQAYQTTVVFQVSVVRPIVTPRD